MGIFQPYVFSLSLFYDSIITNVTDIPWVLVNHVFLFLHFLPSAQGEHFFFMAVIFYVDAVF